MRSASSRTGGSSKASRAEAAWDSIARAVAAGDPCAAGSCCSASKRRKRTLRRPSRVARSCDLVKGFAVGRTIFVEPAVEWFAGRIGDQRGGRAHGGTLSSACAQACGGRSAAGVHSLRTVRRHENHPTDRRAGDGPLPRRPESRDRRPKAAAVRGRVRHLRPRQCRWPRRGALRRPRCAADLPRAQRAGDGACRDRLRQGLATQAHDGLHHPRSAPARPTWSRRRRSRMSTACRCC